jgi:tetratricopeptide (TPR) repeat protein
VTVPLRDGIRHAERALARWPNHPEALFMRGTLRYRIWEAMEFSEDTIAAAAEQDLRGAVDGHPLPALVHERLADLLGPRRRHEEALHYADLAYRQDPYLRRRTPNLLRLYRLNYELGRDVDALRWCEEGLNRAPITERRVFQHCLLELLAWSEVLPADGERAWRLMETALEG